jgi:hypothetical protein
VKWSFLFFRQFDDLNPESLGCVSAGGPGMALTTLGFNFLACRPKGIKVMRSCGIEVDDCYEQLSTIRTLAMIIAGNYGEDAGLLSKKDVVKLAILIDDAAETVEKLLDQHDQVPLKAIGGAV